ncbi:hypothetical protein BD410DRAFT_792122 [Rickenella mellea]|uniref:Uncharacterized protein n=1 Tax=Rickenella mellea TaxID=50990 RepID=A0A4Y7PVT7_9AGAM|nr:hypothetical protein BD410DRAFT_792122 [Rickenella mellea]
MASVNSPAGDSCMAICIAACCTACTASLENWCQFKSFGCECCSNAGCCGSCLNKSFGEDASEEAERKDKEREDAAAAKKTGTAKDVAVDSQPPPSKDMTAEPPT